MTRHPELMNVLYLMTNFPRWDGDVHSPWAVELIHRLAARGVQVTVCAPAYHGLRDHQIEGISVKRYRYAPASWETLTHDSGAPTKIRRQPLYAFLLPSYLLAGSWRVWQLCHGERWDAIHVHWPIPQGLLALAGCPRRRARLISTFYGADLALVRRNPWLKPLLKLVVRRSHAVTAISRYTAGQLTSLCGIEPLVIPYGVDMSQPVEAMAGPKPAPVEILSVGRLIERKGHVILIEAMAYLTQHMEGVALTIIGEGPERLHLERRIAELGLTNRVRLLGRVSDEELQRAYARCDMFVLPSIVDTAGDTEGLGMVLLEAMRYAKPVIASGLGGITDIVEHEVTGLLVPPADAVALAEAMQRLIEEPHLAERLGHAGRQINAERFAWERIVDAYIRLYSGTE